MSKLTGTHSETSEIDFTTLTTVPGTVKVHGAPIQILDLRESSGAVTCVDMSVADELQLESSRAQMMAVGEVVKVSATSASLLSFRR